MDISVCLILEMNCRYWSEMADSGNVAMTPISALAS